METNIRPISTLNLTLAECDRACIWHPFTQMQTARDYVTITKAKGCYLYAEDGRAYLDGVSSWWVNLHGHAHPYIVEKIQVQAELFEHVPFGDFTHRPAIELAVRLLALLPGPMSKIFYSDNGSTAVETALKIALQYWYNQDKKTKRKTVVCFKGGHHGDTFGAMSVSGKNSFNRPFWNHLFDVETIDPPLKGNEEQSFLQLQAILNKEDPACFIFEPRVLGLGGMNIYPSEGLDPLLALCSKHQVITIADEVMTGFGRTGPLFASEQLEEKPDIICLSKGLTGGFLPLGVAACKEYLYQAFLSADRSKALLHGHSYTANPLACVSALASLDLLLTEQCSQARKRIAESHDRFCNGWKNHPKLSRCQSLGTILVLEYFSSDPSYFSTLRDTLYHYFFDHGILLRPLGNVLYVLPPYCIRMEELEHIYAHILLTLENF